MIRIDQRLDWDTSAEAIAAAGRGGPYTMAEVLAELLPRYGLSLDGLIPADRRSEQAAEARPSANDAPTVADTSRADGPQGQVAGETPPTGRHRRRRQPQPAFSSPHRPSQVAAEARTEPPVATLHPAP